jgi:hypothetical protein
VEVAQATQAVMMSSKQSMSRLKSGTGVALVRENPIAREYARSAAIFHRFKWAVPRAA